MRCSPPPAVELLTAAQSLLVTPPTSQNMHGGFTTEQFSPTNILRTRSLIMSHDLF